MGLWESLLETAVYTPSPHNTQPWRLRIAGERRAILYVERARLLPDEDVTGHFQRCAMGMFLESLSIVAANAGYTLNSSLIKNGEDGPLIPFADLELVAGAQPTGIPNSLFHKRATSRLGSNGQLIPPDVRASLQELATVYGQSYHQLDEPEMIERLVRMNIEAVFEDLNDRNYHDEIVRWFRYSDREAESKRDGLDYRCMRVPAAELKLMKVLPQVMRWPVIRTVVGRMYRRQLGSFSHMGLISGPFFDDAASVRAGAFLMRFWLELAKRDLRIHPFGNLVTNLKARRRLEKLAGVYNVWLVFRIGFTAEPPRSYRRFVQEVMTGD